MGSEWSERASATVDEFRKQGLKETAGYATPPHPKNKKLNKLARTRLNRFTKKFIESQLEEATKKKRTHK